MKYPAGWKVGARKLKLPIREYAQHRLAGERWCSHGKHWAPSAMFSPHVSSCRECYRAFWDNWEVEYERKHGKRYVSKKADARRVAFLAAYLAEHGTPYVRKKDRPTEGEPNEAA